MLVPVSLNEKKLEVVNIINGKKYEFPYGLETPSIEKGYQGIANKTIGNAIFAVGLPSFGLGRKGINVVRESVGAAGFVAWGALGLIATPAILAKDLTHHTWRVLSQKFSESSLLSKKS